MSPEAHDTDRRFRRGACPRRAVVCSARVDLRRRRQVSERRTCCGGDCEARGRGAKHIAGGPPDAVDDHRSGRVVQVRRSRPAYALDRCQPHGIFADRVRAAHADRHGHAVHGRCRSAREHPAHGVADQFDIRPRCRCRRRSGGTSTSDRVANDLSRRTAVDDDRADGADRRSRRVSDVLVDAGVVSRRRPGVGSGNVRAGRQHRPAAPLRDQ